MDEAVNGDEIETPQAPTEATPDTDAPELKWQEEAGIENPRFDSFKSVADLAKSYTELETYQHQQVRFPSENASEEDVAKFNQKMLDNGYYKAPTQDDPDSIRNVLNLLGAPAEANGYQFDKIDGFDGDPESEGAFKAVAHEAGLTTAQANKIHGWLGENIAKDAAETAKTAEAGMAELKGEWGQAFEHKVEQAKNATQMLESKVPGISKYFDQMAENGYDANMVRLMDAVSEMLSESGATQTAPRETMTKAEALARVEEIRRNEQHPANDDTHPDYEVHKQAYIDLLKAAYG
jgi:hypothetical protein